ncbi:MAG: hypothetical protein JWM43_460 [Acidobacteriaceae bacterium]|nr:hypothetical protein [Acidobacteriaceae bacterium]
MGFSGELQREGTTIMNLNVKFLGLFCGGLIASAAAQTTTGGSANTVPLFTGGGTLSDSIITQSNGSVGIGGSLGVFQGGFSVSSGTSGASGGFSNIGLSTSGDNSNGGYAAIQAFYAGVGYTTPLFLQSQGGKVGIGTTNPLGILDVGTVGGVVVSGANLDPNGSYNLAPLQNSGKLLLGWNRSGGQGEVDLISNQAGGGNGGFSFYDYTNTGTLNSLVSFQGNGNVGIGTMWPGAKLDVVGNVKLSGSGASLTFPDGTVQSTAWTGTLCGGDYAESINVTGDRKNYEAGDVLVLDPETPGKVLKVIEPYSTLVAGIYSTKRGIVGRRQLTDPKTANTEVPMAMIGIVPTKVSAENGPIKVGDLLVTSSTPGHAMKGTDRNLMSGAVVGKAMGSLASGASVIEVLVTLQ